MSTTGQPNHDASDRPPTYPMPPTPDLNVAVPSTDSLGLPTPPNEPNEPIHGGEPRPSAVGWFTKALAAFVVIAGIAILIWMGQ